MLKRLSGLVLAAFAALTLPTDRAEAQQGGQFMAQVMYFGGNFAPRGWAECDGQLLPIASNTALFSLLGTTFGGDGRSTFALPDMRGRVPLHPGRGPGLSEYRPGQRSGHEIVSLNILNLPSHSHIATLKGSSDVAGADVTAGGMIASSTIYGGRGASIDATLNGGSVITGNTGGNQVFEIVKPYMTVNCIIAIQGVFPSRS